jgi:geranyl-CoA carboxylase alpha subunit
LLFYQHEKATTSAWRNAANPFYHFKLEFDGEVFDVSLKENEGSFLVTALEREYEICLLGLDDHSCTVTGEGIRSTFYYGYRQQQLCIDCGQGHFAIDNVTHRPAVAVGGVGSGQVKASMDGAIVAILVAEGEAVEAGQTLVVLEAMKMEHQLKAGVAGVVESISAQVGQQVKTKQVLATVKNASEESE